MHDEKVIWEEPTIPYFPMVRGETYFTLRDLEQIKRNALPHPQGTPNLNELSDIDILFETFCGMLRGANKNLLKTLARSDVCPFNPIPLRVNTAMFENPGYFIPDKYQTLLFKVWLYQLGEFIQNLCGSDS